MHFSINHRNGLQIAKFSSNLSYICTFQSDAIKKENNYKKKGYSSHYFLIQKNKMADKSGVFHKNFQLSFC